ncbi:HAD-IIIC family phosphatase [Pseudomonadota bacterium]
MNKPSVLVTDVVSWILLWVSPVFSAYLLVEFLNSIGAMSEKGVPDWVIVGSPILYLTWLLIFLLLSAAEMTLLGLYFQKPSRFIPTENLLKRTAIRYIYTRFTFLRHTPLFDFFLIVPPPLRFLRILGMRAYSRAVHQGQLSEVLVWPQDPDLTYIGDFVIIGSESTLVAHGAIQEEDKVLVVTAPIEIESHVTIGGSCRINMGVKIGQGAIVEVGSNVLPFTRIPPGEVWGGNPAVFLRKKEQITNDKHEPSPIRNNSSSESNEDIVTLVASVLGVSEAVILKDPIAKSHTNWDSIANMAISAALYDRFGVQVAQNSLEYLNSIQGIRDIMDFEVGNTRVASENNFTLPKDPGLYPLYDYRKITASLSTIQSRDLEIPEHTLLIASTFTVTPIISTTKTWCKGIGIPYSVEACEYNQIEQELLLPDSKFSKNKNGLNLILVRVEDLMLNGDDGMARVNSILDAIKAYTKMSRPTLMISNLSPVISSFFLGRKDDVEKLRIYWDNSLKKYPTIQIFDSNSVIADIGILSCRDSESEVIARAPFSQHAYQYMGVSIARHINKIHTPSKKVIALDCDNTLWGGVIGEEGIDGISLGDDHPGRSFKLFQQQLLKLKERGILLVIVSKNEENDVWQVMDEHPDMLIKKEDISAYRINWHPKSENIKSLAEEMNLGIDSFVFFDDSPAECLEVSTNSPSVSVVELTMRPENFCDVLSKLWFFDVMKVTDEDKLRAGFLVQNQKRETLKNESSDLSDYLNSLKLQVCMRIATEHDMPRVSQLTNKTNQFNLSLRRRTLSDLQTIADDHFIIAAEVKDIFGDYGLVGVCILKHNAESESLFMDTFLMSCRTLGREVELSFINGVRMLADKLDCKSVHAQFIPGPRNQQIIDFLSKSGFESVNSEGKGMYHANKDKLVPLPKHIDWVFKLN